MQTACHRSFSETHGLQAKRLAAHSTTATMPAEIPILQCNLFCLLFWDALMTSMCLERRLNQLPSMLLSHICLWTGGNTICLWRGGNNMYVYGEVVPSSGHKICPALT